MSGICDIYFYNLYITDTANPCEIDISARIICDFSPYYKMEEIQKNAMSDIDDILLSEFSAQYIYEQTVWHDG